MKVGGVECSRLKECLQRPGSHVVHPSIIFTTTTTSSLILFFSQSKENSSIPCILPTFRPWLYLLYLSHCINIISSSLSSSFACGYPSVCLHPSLSPLLPLPFPSSPSLSQHAPLGQQLQGARLNPPPPAGALQLRLAEKQAPWHISSKHTHSHTQTHTRGIQLAVLVCLRSISLYFIFSRLLLTILFLYSFFSNVLSES